MELPVVNHKDYVAKIDDDHKFPIKKFGELAKNGECCQNFKISFNAFMPLQQNLKKKNRSAPQIWFGLGSGVPGVPLPELARADWQVTNCPT